MIALTSKIAFEKQAKVNFVIYDEHLHRVYVMYGCMGSLQSILQYVLGHQYKDSAAQGSNVYYDGMLDVCIQYPLRLATIFSKCSKLLGFVM